MVIKMKNVQKAILTNMCMVCDDAGRVLAQERLNPDWPGITFPGGHIEPEESFVDSIIREVYEETGLTISNPKLCGLKQWTYDDGTRYIVICYRTDKFTGSLKSSREGRVFWTTIPEMLGMKLAVGTEHMIKLFTDNKYSEHYLVKRGGKWEDELK